MLPGLLLRHGGVAVLMSAGAILQSNSASWRTRMAMWRPAFACLVNLLSLLKLPAYGSPHS